MKKNPKTKTVRTTKSSSSLELSSDDILGLIKDVIPKDAKNVRIYVQVPGGADWANTQLVIGEDVVLNIEWETEKTEKL